VPELPDLVYIRPRLEAAIQGHTIEAVSVREPVVLRMLVEGDFPALLAGKMCEAVHRHGPFLRIELSGDLDLVVHPMLAGRFQLDGKPGRGRCFTLHLSGEPEVHYLDDKKMGKVYLVRRGAYESIPRYLSQGVKITGPEFTLSLFRDLLRGRRQQVRVFLMDQTALSAIGNAYADEILFEAGIHPKTTCSRLGGEEIERLYQSVRKVIQWGIDEVEKAAQPIHIKVRDHMRVRNRKGQPCPRCGTTIRRVGVLGYDSFFCPRCQPATRRQFIDWNR